MIAWLALGAIGLFLLWLGARAFVSADPKALAKGLRIGGAIASGGLAVFFLLRGRIDMAMMLGALGAAAMGYLPWRLLPFGRLFGGGTGSGWSRAKTGGFGDAGTGGGSSGQTSQVETAWLRMQLDHGSGRMTGTVLQGRFAGRTLAALDFTDLLILLRECDSQSAALLETWLDRNVGPDWREQASAAGAGAGSAAAGGMTRDQAWEILGLSPGASPAEIRAAHRRLMKSAHPDQGGSTWLAAQINRAKDLLLDQ